MFASDRCCWILLDTIRPTHIHTDIYTCDQRSALVLGQKYKYRSSSTWKSTMGIDAEAGPREKGEMEDGGLRLN